MKQLPSEPSNLEGPTMRRYPPSSPKTHVATLREFPARSGKPYFKGRFGDALVFLFQEDTLYRTENGRDYYDWNLVITNDYNVIRGYRDAGPHQEDGPMAETGKTASNQQAIAARRRRTRAGRSR
jgi:hypothetical protein